MKIEQQDLLEQSAIALINWFEAEENHKLASFHERMDLCRYSEYCARKALGQDISKFEEDGEFVGVPRMILKL